MYIDSNFPSYMALLLCNLSPPNHGDFFEIETQVFLFDYNVKVFIENKEQRRCQRCKRYEDFYPYRDFSCLKSCKECNPCHPCGMCNKMLNFWPPDGFIKESDINGIGCKKGKGCANSMKAILEEQKRRHGKTGMYYSILKEARRIRMENTRPTLRGGRK